MLFQFGNVLVFFLVGGGFVFVSLLLNYLLSPKVPTAEKLAPYECGEIPIEGAWTNFNIRFYIIALLFIIFDVEIAFMFPIATIFKEWVKSGSGLLILGEVAVFVLILLLGLAYAWVKGDLEWATKMEFKDKVSGKDIVPGASKVG
ncbi:MAG: NADH-quinone oxidoreductase subunit A [Deltaproteobacteria bacterium]|nr:MAG: NADH-quinone oxidoreductase subunit A [Deltaproteobacteria bacterium]